MDIFMSLTENNTAKIQIINDKNKKLTNFNIRLKFL